MDYRKLVETMDDLKETFLHFETMLEDYEDKEDLFTKLSFIYIQNFRESFIEATNIIAFKQVIEEDYNIVFDEIEDLVNNLVQINELIPKAESEKEDTIEYNEYSQQSGESGYIYLLINPSMVGVVKIGKTTRDPETRAKELSSATGVPTPFTLVYKEYFSDCSIAESAIHDLLEDKGYRLSSNREFFNIPIPDAINLIQEVKQILPNNDYSSYKNVNDQDSNNDTYQLVEDLIEEGENYLHGYGDTLQNFDKAIKSLEKAGKLGSAKAYLIIGKAYVDSLFKEDGLKLSIPKALEYFEKGSVLNGLASNHCLAEMASAFSGRHEGIDENFQHLNNAKTCWKKFIKNITIKNSDFNDKYYLVDYISYFLFATKDFPTLRADVLEDSLEIINWFKYDIKEIIDSSGFTFNSLPDHFILKQRIIFLQDFLNDNFNLLDSKNNFNFSIVDINKLDANNIIINGNLSEGTLFVDNILGFHTAGGSDYSIVKEIILENENVSKAETGQDITIIVENTFDDYEYIEFLISNYQDEKIQVSKSGTFTYNRSKFDKEVETSPISNELLNNKTSDVRPTDNKQQTLASKFRNLFSKS